MESTVILFKSWYIQQQQQKNKANNKHTNFDNFKIFKIDALIHKKIEQL